MLSWDDDMWIGSDAPPGMFETHREFARFFAVACVVSAMSWGVVFGTLRVVQWLGR